MRSVKHIPLVEGFEETLEIGTLKEDFLDPVTPLAR